MSLRILITTLVLLGVGTFGSFAAVALGWPMPYVLGSLLTSAIIATSLPHRLPAGYDFPQKLRAAFIAVIGLVIGAQVTSALFSQAPKLIYSFAALTVFVIVAQGMNYLIFKHVGKYDRQTAFFAGSPGGLFESISLGEEAGADLRLLMLQQFLRIILVVTLVPIGFSWWYGAPVGSASGISLSHGTTPPSQIWPFWWASGRLACIWARFLDFPHHN
ncbi:MAG: AbrB family transcriptional regulator [Rhodobacterales bacterium]|nr:AbrB family transcriptional regulator [Rhodobacterales bacterium]